MIPYTHIWRARAGYGYVDEIPRFGYPVVDAFYEGRDGRWLPLRSELDTGADDTVLPKSFADTLAMYSEPKALVIKQVEGTVEATIFTGRIALMDKTFRAPIISIDGPVTPLIGRAGLLDNFEVRLKRDGFEIIPY